ncbi:MAG: hypothetical protein J6K51_01750 [Clostridia bacterium]|nr:hypothetical protein [Clostridia bacterium]
MAKKQTELLNMYLKWMLEEYKPSNVTDSELQSRNDFFNHLPEKWQKIIYQTAIRTHKYFPKLAELNAIYDNLVKNKNLREHGFTFTTNTEKCELCQDSGFVEYFRYGDKVLSEKEYFSNVKQYFGKCKKHICTCKCNVGQSKENSNHFYRYTDLFPDIL